MNKGRRSAQRSSAPRGTMKLEQGSASMRSNGRTATQQTQLSLVGEKMQDQFRSAKPIVKGWLQKVAASPWLLHEKKIITSQTEESVRSHWVNLSRYDEYPSLSESMWYI